MITEKAGCFLIKKETKEIALIYRKKQNDYSFPKGHVEKGETLKEAAIRETAEETKRIAKIVDEYEPFAEKYITPRGENCVCYMFFALDNGVSDNQSEDTHDIIWTQQTNVCERIGCILIYRQDLGYIGSGKKSVKYRFRRDKGRISLEGL